MAIIGGAAALNAANAIVQYNGFTTLAWGAGTALTTTAGQGAVAGAAAASTAAVVSYGSNVLARRGRGAVHSTDMAPVVNSSDDRPAKRARQENVGSKDSNERKGANNQTTAYDNKTSRTLYAHDLLKIARAEGLWGNNTRHRDIVLLKGVKLGFQLQSLQTTSTIQFRWMVAWNKKGNEPHTEGFWLDHKGNNRTRDFDDDMDFFDYMQESINRDKFKILKTGKRLIRYGQSSNDPGISDVFYAEDMFIPLNELYRYKGEDDFDKTMELSFFYWGVQHGTGLNAAGQSGTYRIAIKSCTYFEEPVLVKRLAGKPYMNTKRRKR